MDVLRVDRLPAEAWKNKGGITRALAAQPPGADFETADWRVDLSAVAGPGPFSRFPGYDRMLMPLASGLRLSLADAPPLAVEIFRPFAFDGETPVRCELAAEAVAGGVPVLNLLLRHGRHSGRLVCFAGSGRVQEPDGAAVLYAARGGFRLVLGGGSPVPLDAGHAAVHREAAPLAFEPYKPWSMMIAALITPAG